MGKGRRRKRYTRKRGRRVVFSCLVLVFIVGLFTYIIFRSNLFDDRVSVMSSSYISFNGYDSTDMIRIDNLKRMNNKIGRSYFNSKSVLFNVRGNKDMEYDIVLYSIGNSVDSKMVWFCLNDGCNRLDRMKVLDDGGVVIYNGKVDGSNKYKLKMWLSRDVGHVSYEVKIKPR